MISKRKMAEENSGDGEWKLVVVTGYQPFGTATRNPSGEAVELLQDLPRPYRLVRQQVRVVYSDVDRLVSNIWSQAPFLVIHVGVSPHTEHIKLEILANSKNYTRPDETGKLPEDGKNCRPGDDIIASKLDVFKICNDFNAQFKDMKTELSLDAGRFLCEYIYYSSLAMDPSRSLFIHVPDFSKSYTVAQISDGLYAIIKLCITQLETKS